MYEKIALTFNNMDEILDFAVKNEEEAHAFYTAWSKKLDNKALSAVFLELAAEENKHKDYILRVKQGQTLKPSEKEIFDLKIADYTTNVKASTDMDYQDALTLAMHKEKEAYKLYSALAEIAKETGMKTTFKALAQEEAKHKLRLELIYDEEILKEN